MQNHSSDCYPILLNMQCHIFLNMQSHIWLNKHSHSREASGTPRLINMQSRRVLPFLLNMQSHSREATVMRRRRGVAASTLYIWLSILLRPGNPNDGNFRLFKNENGLTRHTYLVKSLILS